MQKNLTGLKKVLIMLFSLGVIFSYSNAYASEVKKSNDQLSSIIHKLGVHKFNKSDPGLFAEVLQNDMFLADLESVQVLFAESLTKPVQLNPMVMQIIKSIRKKHPAVVEFLIEADNRGLIPDSDENDEVVKRVIHHTYLLEILTNEMANDWEFMVEVQNHMLGKREAMGLPSDFMSSVLGLYYLTGNLFEPIKTKTMDWVFSEYHKIRERGEILPAEIFARQNGTKLNILEASISESHAGFMENAMTGIALAINPPESLRVVGDSDFIEYDVSQEWVSLYETWNLAFITGNVNHLDLLYPKLLIPSVIDAEPKDYLFNRALSLWVSVNFKLFADFTQRTHHPVPNADELSQLWGEINHKYAVNYVAEKNGTDLNNFSYLLGMTYDMIWDQLKMLLVASGVITMEEAQLLTGIFEDMP